MFSISRFNSTSLSSFVSHFNTPLQFFLHVIPFDRVIQYPLCRIYPIPGKVDMYPIPYSKRYQSPSDALRMDVGVLLPLIDVRHGILNHQTHPAAGLDYLTEPLHLGDRLSHHLRATIREQIAGVFLLDTEIIKPLNP